MDAAMAAAAAMTIHVAAVAATASIAVDISAVAAAASVVSTEEAAEAAAASTGAAAATVTAIPPPPGLGIVGAQRTERQSRPYREQYSESLGHHNHLQRVEESSRQPAHE
jgi:hypothetical protein